VVRAVGRAGPFCHGGGADETERKSHSVDRTAIKIDNRGGFSTDYEVLLHCIAKF